MPLVLIVTDHYIVNEIDRINTFTVKSVQELSDTHMRSGDSILLDLNEEKYSIVVKCTSKYYDEYISIAVKDRIKVIRVK